MKTKSNMCIKVSFLAGTSVKDAVTEAKKKAELFDVAYVKFNFNGASFSIGRNADVIAAVNEYSETYGKPYGIIYS